MTAEQATELLDHAITSVGDGGAYLYRIASGEHVVRVKARDYWLWTWQDLEVYAHDLKAKRKAKRKAEHTYTKGIDPEELYRLAI